MGENGQLEGGVDVPQRGEQKMNQNRLWEVLESLLQSEFLEGGNDLGGEVEVRVVLAFLEGPQGK